MPPSTPRQSPPLALHPGLSNVEMQLSSCMGGFYGASRHDANHVLTSLPFPWRCFGASHAPSAFSFLVVIVEMALIHLKTLDWDCLICYRFALSPSALRSAKEKLSTVLG